MQSRRVTRIAFQICFGPSSSSLPYGTTPKRIPSMAKSFQKVIYKPNAHSLDDFMVIVNGEEVSKERQFDWVAMNAICHGRSEWQPNNETEVNTSDLGTLIDPFWFYLFFLSTKNGSEVVSCRLFWHGVLKRWLTFLSSMLRFFCRQVSIKIIFW